MNSTSRAAGGPVDLVAMPPFGFDAYRDLLGRFAGAGYASRLVSELDDPGEPERVVYLRHDLDFLTSSALPFAHAEAEQGFRATYYALLTGPYNAFSPADRAALRRLVELGHEVGLHYDMQAFAGAPGAARAELNVQRRALEDAIGAPVTTISTHNPSSGGEDPFRTVPGLRHPHDPRDERELFYVSDSRRSWRDDRLLECFGAAPPPRVMFLTHPELWLAPEIGDARTYLHRVLDEAEAPLRTYFTHDVPALWGAPAIAPGGEPLRIEYWDRDAVLREIEPIERLFAQFTAVPWERDQILSDRPGKWEHTVIALVGDRIEGFSFNSLRDGFLYIHALFVAPEARGTGLGTEIMQSLERRVREHGLAGIRLRVAYANVGALMFYLASGFEIIDSEPDQHQLVLDLPGASHTNEG